MPARNASVRVALGALLLATAGLKLYGLGVSSVPQVGWFSQLWVQLLAAEWELVLGGWLLSGARPRLSWLAALVTFVCFAGVSGYLGWVGVASCGCLGAIKANPWWAFGIDAGALTALALSRPAPAPNAPPHWQPIARVAAGVGLTLVAILSIGSGLSGSPSAFLARLRGEPLAVSAAYFDLGTGSKGESRESSVEVRNWSDRPVRLVGGTSDCSCLTTAD